MVQEFFGERVACTNKNWQCVDDGDGDDGADKRRQTKN